MTHPPTPSQLVTAIGDLLARYRETGDESLRTAAVDMVAAALRDAEETGETAGRAMARAEEEGTDDDGRDPAEDYEPDISEVGFNAYTGGYDDDC